tara:strand:+ start:106 stop:348 length:243 start_codon:yes stop_codon:yes gene_type:complete
MANDLQLTKLQKKAIFDIAKADDRTPEQQLARVLSRGLSFLYGDYVDSRICLEDHSKSVEDLASDIENEMRKTLGLKEVA